ncbi:signal transducer and activator of transcription C isoform X2 [Hippoglossus stenolepis]|uniref:signal transducer and activator of transcription C isoform X2 n=1 Tax=Hippoglossus stenolepis TaxID=195615 RepID=UPI001FAFF947|nr:signal transducer and activator of transcription C isoform X2 [Hippoglossus stenolepis]
MLLIPSKSSNRPATMIPPESRLQTPLTVPVAPRKVRRRPWSSAEKEAVWRQLGVHVLVQTVPGKEVCQRCLDLEPVLRGRHWKDIKNQVHNQIQSQKKQQFHAQMDLQDPQEQQNQEHDQTQKKQHQHFQAQMDQHGKDQTQNQKKLQYHAQIDHQDQDNVQNQKKQQYHLQLDQQNQDHTMKKQQFQVQMDHQDQESIQNHKKQHYHTQMDHQDHLQIHKKQLCHSRLEHPDHIQVHKKQLYQMDQQTQALQSTLDRDASSLLTGTPFGPDGPHRATGLSLVERDPIISPYPLPHRAPGLNMDQLLPRTEWTDESLAQNYPINRQLARNLLPDAPTGGPLPNPHSGHVHF